MGKYGFNENELVKTVTDMIDKDGFHKQVITYGKPEPEVPPIAAGTVASANAVDATKFDVTLIVTDVPEDALVYAKASATDDDYDLDIGDELESSALASYIALDTEISGISAVLGVDSAVTGGGTVYYHVYAVDVDSIVLDRTKTEADLS